MEPAQLFCLCPSTYGMMDCVIEALTGMPIFLSSNLSYGLEVLRFPSGLSKDDSSLSPPD